jgi:hypothetical protein
MAKRNNDDCVTTVVYKTPNNPDSQIAFLGCPIDDVETVTVEDVKKCIAAQEGVAPEDVSLGGVWGDREARENVKQ